MESQEKPPLIVSSDGTPLKGQEEPREDPGIDQEQQDNQDAGEKLRVCYFSPCETYIIQYKDENGVKQPAKLIIRDMQLGAVFIIAQNVEAVEMTGAEVEALETMLRRAQLMGGMGVPT